MNPRRSPLLWLLEAMSLVLLLGTLGLAASRWNELPQRIPTHFGISGAPDAWGGKNSLWFLVGVNIFVYAVMTFASRYPAMVNIPFTVDRQNPEVRRILFQLTSVMKALCGLLFGWIIYAITETALGRAAGLGKWFLPVFLAGMFLPLIPFLVQLRRTRR